MLFLFACHQSGIELDSSWPTEGIDVNAPIEFLFKDVTLSQYYVVTIDGVEYIYIYNRHNGSVAITKK